jgi:hypothetical protein
MEKVGTRYVGDMCMNEAMTVHCPNGTSQGIASTNTKCSIVHNYYLLLHPSIILAADSKIRAAD